MTELTMGLPERIILAAARRLYSAAVLDGDGVIVTRKSGKNHRFDWSKIPKTPDWPLVVIDVMKHSP